MATVGSQECLDYDKTKFEQFWPTEHDNLVAKLKNLIDIFMALPRRLTRDGALVAAIHCNGELGCLVLVADHAAPVALLERVKQGACSFAVSRTADHVVVMCRYMGQFKGPPALVCGAVNEHLRGLAVTEGVREAASIVEADPLDEGKRIARDESGRLRVASIGVAGERMHVPAPSRHHERPWTGGAPAAPPRGAAAGGSDAVGPSGTTLSLEQLLRDVISQRREEPDVAHLRRMAAANASRIAPAIPPARITYAALTGRSPASKMALRVLSSDTLGSYALAEQWIQFGMPDMLSDFPLHGSQVHAVVAAFEGEVLEHVVRTYWAGGLRRLLDDLQETAEALMRPCPKLARAISHRVFRTYPEIPAANEPETVRNILDSIAAVGRGIQKLVWTVLQAPQDNCGTVAAHELIEPVLQRFEHARWIVAAAGSTYDEDGRPVRPEPRQPSSEARPHTQRVEPVPRPRVNPPSLQPTLPSGARSWAARDAEELGPA